jgi:hypothetical protein
MQTLQMSNRPFLSWLEHAIAGCIFLIAVFAPHSIAATQTFWLLGLVLWVSRFAFTRDPNSSAVRSIIGCWLFLS